jgi:hypothetical protein
VDTILAPVVTDKYTKPTRIRDPVPTMRMVVRSASRESELERKLRESRHSRLQDQVNIKSDVTFQVVGPTISPEQPTDVHTISKMDQVQEPTMPKVVHLPTDQSRLENESEVQEVK